MTRWEYKTISVRRWDQNVSDHLTEVWGRDGWEAWHMHEQTFYRVVEPGDKAEECHGWYVYLKRPVKTWRRLGCRREWTEGVGN